MRRFDHFLLTLLFVLLSQTLNAKETQTVTRDSTKNTVTNSEFQARSLERRRAEFIDVSTEKIKALKKATSCAEKASSISEIKECDTGLKEMFKQLDSGGKKATN